MRCHFAQRWNQISAASALVYVTLCLSIIVMNSLDSRFSRNVFEALHKTRRTCFIRSKTTRLRLGVSNPDKTLLLVFQTLHKDFSIKTWNIVSPRTSGNRHMLLHVVDAVMICVVKTLTQHVMILKVLLQRSKEKKKQLMFLEINITDATSPFLTHEKARNFHLFNNFVLRFHDWSIFLDFQFKSAVFLLPLYDIQDNHKRDLF